MVAAVQYKARRPDLGASREALVDRVRQAAEGPTRLVVFPEMAVSGYVFADRDAVAAVAEPADGPTFAALAAVARAQGCAIIGGFPERDGATLYNSAWVIGPDGALVTVYRKTLLYSADEPWACAGTGAYGELRLDGRTVLTGICMDINDDAFVEVLRERQPDVVAFPTNWVAEEPPTVDVWDYWAWRLQGVRGALVAANTWGEESAVGVGATRFTGRSAVIQGYRLRGHLGPTGDGILRVALPG